MSKYNIVIVFETNETHFVNIADGLIKAIQAALQKFRKHSTSKIYTLKVRVLKLLFRILPNVGEMILEQKLRKDNNVIYS